MNTWATTDDLGVIAFQTKKAAKEMHPSCRFIRCEFAMGFLGWLAIDPYGTDNNGTVETPNGRKIPVVSGYTSEYGRLIGFRGGKSREQFDPYWRAIMARVIEAGLTLNAYQNREEK